MHVTLLDYMHKVNGELLSKRTGSAAMFHQLQWTFTFLPPCHFICMFAMFVNVGLHVNNSCTVFCMPIDQRMRFYLLFYLSFVLALCLE